MLGGEELEEILDEMQSFSSLETLQEILDNFINANMKTDHQKKTKRKGLHHKS